METLSNKAVQEKNKLCANSLFLFFLDIVIPGVSQTIHIVNNNENLTWDERVYQAFPFDIEEISESLNGEVSEFVLKVGNANNIIGNYVRQYDAYVKNNGFEPIKVTVSVVNTENLTLPLAEVQHQTTLIKPSITSQQVTFTLGGSNAYNKTIHSRMLRNACRFSFKSVKCGYFGIEISCNKTFARCKELSNQKRFGGFPLIGNKGVLL